MDYSLLVIVETNQKWIEMKKQQQERNKLSQVRKQTKDRNMSVKSRTASDNSASNMEFEDHTDFFNKALRPTKKSRVFEGKYSTF